MNSNNKKAIKQQLFLGSLFAVGVSSIAIAPSYAGTFNGTVSGTNIYYGFNGTNTYQAGTNVTSVTLTGDRTNPENNIELGTETSVFTSPTTLTGNIGGQSITLSSLTAADWFNGGSTTVYGNSDVANSWFNSALSKYNMSFLSTAQKTQLFNSFLNNKGFQRASDPNISYVNVENDNIVIGLAGHFDLKTQIQAFLNSIPALKPLASQVPSGVQLSEVVKITYGGNTGIFSSGYATKTGFFELSDGQSHNGNYEIFIPKLSGGDEPESTPESSTAMALILVGGLFAFRQAKK